MNHFQLVDPPRLLLLKLLLGISDHISIDTLTLMIGTQGFVKLVLGASVQVVLFFDLLLFVHNFDNLALQGVLDQLVPVNRLYWDHLVLGSSPGSRRCSSLRHRIHTVRHILN